MAEVITVSALNQYVKTLLDANDILFDLALRGEIANFVQRPQRPLLFLSPGRQRQCQSGDVPLGCAAARLPPGRGHEGSRAMPCYSL